jgi:hypothetical protein
MQYNRRFLNITVNRNDNYELCLQKLHQELANALACPKWIHHVACAGMIEFYSRPAIFIIPDDMTYDLDMQIINLLTNSFCGVDLRRTLHRVNYDSVYQYVPISALLDACENVDFAVCMMGEPRVDYRAPHLQDQGGQHQVLDRRELPEIEGHHGGRLATQDRRSVEG